MENIRSPENSERTMRAITTEKIKEIIGRLKINKAPGWDMFMNRMLKELLEDFLEERMKMLSNGIMENYRPISLLGYTSKIMERIIFRRIKEEEKQVGIITTRNC